MKKRFGYILIIVLFMGVGCHAQSNIDEVTDSTDQAESGLSDHVLKGTTFLPYSKRNIGLLNAGLEPIELTKTGTCDGREKVDSRAYPKIIDVNRDGDILTVDIIVASYCGDDFLGEAEVNGDTLNLVYISYGDFAACTCCYTLRYSFNTALEEYNEIIKFVTVHNNTAITKEVPAPKP